MTVDWYKCKGDIWCDLFKVDVQSHLLKHISGVYILWTGSLQNMTVIKVGYGILVPEINISKQDFAIAAFASHGVFITWSKIPAISQKSICNYLIHKLQPRIYKFIPAADRIEVNLPWII